jgi:protein CrcB
MQRLSKDKLPEAPLFTRDDGKPWAHSDWDALVREAAEKAGLPKGVCLYTLRHSFITQTLLEGLSTLEVSRMVGTSLTMIEKHYGHLVTDNLPIGTLAANLLGGYAIGVAIAWFAKHPGLLPEWRLLVITGFLGGLTTFSTFSAEVVHLAGRQQYG